jgi:hypothetical protein
LSSVMQISWIFVLSVSQRMQGRITIITSRLQNSFFKFLLSKKIVHVSGCSVHVSVRVVRLFWIFEHRRFRFFFNFSNHRESLVPVISETSKSQPTVFAKKNGPIIDSFHERTGGYKGLFFGEIFKKLENRGSTPIPVLLKKFVHHIWGAIGNVLGNDLGTWVTILVSG